MSYFKIFIAFICSFLLFSSSCVFENNENNSLLSSAEAIMESNPIGALNILDSIPNLQKQDENLYNKYLLLRVMAKEKASQDIKEDTVIFQTRDYYSAKGDEINAAWASFYSGRVLQERQNKEKAALAYFQAKYYAKNTDDYNLKGLIEYYIGELYFGQYMKDEAISFFKQASLYFAKTNKYKNQINTYNRIGMSFHLKREMNSAFYYYEKALSLTALHKDLLERAFAKQNMGYAFENTGNIIEARKYFEESLLYFHDSANQAKVYLNIARTFDTKKDKDSISYYIGKSYELVKNEKNPSLLLSIYKLQSKQEEDEGNYPQALDYYKKYTRLLNKIEQETRNASILEIQKKHDFELIKNENNRLLKQHQSNTLIILLLCIILVISSIFYRKQVKNKEDLSNAKQKICYLNDMANSIDSKEALFKTILAKHFDILKKAALLEGYLKEDEKKQGQKLLRKFNEIVYNQETLDWNMVFDTMGQLYDGFPIFLREQFPELDLNDIKICCLTYAGLNNTEIAIIMELSINTIQIRKSNIRKKLGIEGYGNLIEFFKDKMKK